MNITQLSEHLKDIPQDTLVGYAKNPTGVVPQFLALAEIQRRQELQAPQNQAPASTVAQDVLSRAAPQIPQMPPQMPPQMAQPPQMAALPENQPGVASLPTGMAQGMAGGGIVAFASGGETDDEDEDVEMARLFPQKSGINVEEVLAGIRGLAGKFPQSYDAEKAKAVTVSQRGSHPYEAIALDEAKKLGIDPKLVQHILYKETGNLRDPATARSHAGAYGPMQLMPGTAKELGIDIADPEQNTRGGVRYFAKMLNQFGDPTHAMAAYNAGPGRVSEMLRRGRGIESLPRETQGYVRMAQGGIAHFANTGLVGPEGSPMEQYLSENPPLEKESINPPPEQESKSLTAAEKQAAFREKQLQKLQASARSSGPAYGESESVFERLRNPTKFLNDSANGIRNLIPRIVPSAAAIGVPAVVGTGGAVLSTGATNAIQNNPAFLEQYGGSDYGDPGGDSSIAAAILSPANRQLAKEPAPAPTPTRAIRGQGDIRSQENQMYPNTPGFGSNQSASGQPVGMPTMSLNGRQNPETYGLSGNFLQAPEPTTPMEVAAPKSKSDEYFDLLAKDIQERAAKAKEEGDMNKWLAIMQAGFGMMSGQSPYALTNIGKGAEQGISTYGALRKQTADELKDIGVNRLGLAKYQAAKEGAAETRDLNKAIREATLEQEGTKLKSGEAKSKAELDYKISEGKRKDLEFKEAHALRVEEKLRKSLENRYDMTPEQKEAFIMSHPLYRQAFKDIGIDIGTFGGPIKITDKADYDKLKPGQQYIDPQGQLRTKG
jgi:soluble lytic murein transglycosylase-like protein